MNLTGNVPLGKARVYLSLLLGRQEEGDDKFIEKLFLPGPCAEETCSRLKHGQPSHELPNREQTQTLTIREVEAVISK